MGANRHLSRTVAMQALFSWEFQDEPRNLEPAIAAAEAEFGEDLDVAYVRRVCEGTVAHLEEIDGLLQEAAPEWPVDQVARVDRNVLRVAIFELLFDATEDVPPRVAINEAIEIGKRFGAESTPRFVNGALGYVYRKFEDRLAPRDANAPAKPVKDAA